MIQWQFYPKSLKIPSKLLQVIEVFKKCEKEINSETHIKQESNDVLKIVGIELENVGFKIETGKKSANLIKVPVLFGKNGVIEKSFQADAYEEKEGIVIEIEAGRAVVNNQFLKDLFQACMMYNVKFLIIAVRNQYIKSRDFDSIIRFFDTLYASDRLHLPLDGILLIGY